MRAPRKALTALAIALAASANAQQTNVTEARATQIAAEYCRALEIPANGTPSVVHRTADEMCYLSRWKVSWPDQADVEVADSTGAVLRVYNAALPKSLGRQPVGAAILESDAVERATRALRLARVGDDLTYCKAVCAEHSDLAANHTWAVYWRRSWQGIPYTTDGARALLNAETGALVGFGATLTSPAPANEAANVAPAAAAIVAFAKMTATGRGTASPVMLQAEILQPNAFFEPGGTSRLKTGAARVVWVCEFFNVERGWEKDYYVYVDAQSGAVVGGESGGPMGYRHPPELGQRFRAAREVRVYGRAKNGAWTAKPIATISPRANPAVFAALGQTGAPAAPPKAFGNFKVSIISDDPGPFDLAYVEDSGVLGWGPQWTAAPKGLTDLVRRAQAAAK